MHFIRNSLARPFMQLSVTIQNEINSQIHLVIFLEKNETCSIERGFHSLSVPLLHIPLTSPMFHRPIESPTAALHHGRQRADQSHRTVGQDPTI